MSKLRYILICSCTLAAFAGTAGAQQNIPVSAASPGSSPAADTSPPGADAKPLTNERIVSMFKAGIGENTIISLISNLPAEFNISPEALITLRDAGVSGAIIDALKLRAEKNGGPERLNSAADGNLQAKPLTNQSVISMSRSGMGDSTIISLISLLPAELDSGPEGLSDLRSAGVSVAVISAIERRAAGKTGPPREQGKNPPPPAENHPSSAKWALGLVYPGAALKYQTGGKTAWEVKAQSGSGVFAAGPRFYYRLGSNPGFSLFCGAEADYIGFKGKVSEGSGFAGGAFVGGDIPFTEHLSLSMDFGPMYMDLSDKEFSESSSGVDYIVNMGIYWLFN